MYRIAICDDERPQAELLQGYVAGWSHQRREPVETGLFPSAEAFLFAWEEDKAWDALLLDIQMAGLDGMKLARTLRGQGCSIPIVFVTGIPDHMDEGYEVEALHYLMKPVRPEKLFACLDRAVQKVGQEKSLLLEAVDGQALRISPCHIALLEAFGHRTRVTLRDGESVEAKVGFRELCAQLPSTEFIQCHRSYVVGLRHIQRLGKDQLVLDSGTAVPVSRRLFGQTNAAFVAFYRQAQETEGEGRQ